MTWLRGRGYLKVLAMAGITFTLSFAGLEAARAQASAGSAACDSIPDVWAWFANGDATIRPGGTVAQGDITGRWICDPSNGEIIIVWSHGFTDRLTLSADRQRLTGTNNSGERITVERKFSATQPPATPAPQAASPTAAAPACNRVAGEWAWNAGGIVTFFADGLAGQGNRRGRWTCNEDRRQITLVWNDGATANLVLSPDGRRLNGRDNRGYTVAGEIRAAAAAGGSDPQLDALFRDFFPQSPPSAPPSSSTAPPSPAPPQIAQASPQAAQASPLEQSGGWGRYQGTVTLKALADNPGRGVLGIRIAGTDAILEALRPGQKAGVLVILLNQGSASEGVLQRGDIIVAASGRATNSPAELVNAVSRFTPGMPVVLEFWRYAGGFPQLQAALFARAQQNDPPATYVLGYFETTPAAGEPNHARAFGFYHRAAALGHLQAIEATANAYREGRGTERNTQEAAKWYRIAVDRGATAAMYNLANLVVDGQIGPADPAEAFRLMQRAAAGGYAMAHYRLADYFDLGRGTIRDPQAGARHLIAAARATPEMPLFIGTDLAKTNPSTELITALQQQLSEAGVYQGPRDGKLSLDVTAALGRLQSGPAR